MSLSTAQLTLRPLALTGLHARWSILAAVVIGLLAVGLRLYHLDYYVDHIDEATYLQSLILMRQGYVPFRDFFSSQGPLFLPLLFPFSAFGTVLGPRLGVFACTLLGLLAVGAVARRRGGIAAALMALLALGISPMFLEESRLVLAEVPAVALAAVAFWLAHRAPERSSLALAAAVLMVALLIKPMVGAVAVAVLILVVAARLPRREWRALVVDLLIMAIVAAVVLSVSVVPFGVGNVYDQFIRFHHAVTVVAQREGPAGGWENVGLARGEILREGAGLYALAALGLVLALTRRSASDLALVVWLVGTAAMLWLYVPYYDRYYCLMIPPLALLAADGARAALGLAGVRRWARMAPILAVLLYAAWLPPVLLADLGIAESTWHPDDAGKLRAAHELAAATRPDELVVTDDPVIALLAGRTVAPPLVDVSQARIKTGSLTAASAQAGLDAYGVNVILWWSDVRFSELAGFRRRVEKHFVKVRPYQGREDEQGLYVRRTAADPPQAKRPS